MYACLTDSTQDAIASPEDDDDDAALGMGFAVGGGSLAVGRFLICKVMGQGVGGLGEGLVLVLVVVVVDCDISGLRGGGRNEGDVIPALKHSVEGS